MQNDALLRAVIASPDDDAPRLIYADWLDEQGDADSQARAEFIRVQCALATLPEDAADREALLHIEQTLLERHAYRWAADLSPIVSQWSYRRGFIERVEMNLQAPAGEIGATLCQAPIRHIRDVSQTPNLASVTAMLPELHCLTGLEFWGLYTVDDELLRAILNSPHLRNLKTLILSYDSAGRFAREDMIVEALLSPHRKPLEDLAVNVDGVARGPSERLLQAIAASPHLRNLRKLDLSYAGAGGPPLDLDMLQQLGASPNLAQLHELDLRGAHFTHDGWREASRWPCKRSLKLLRLNGAMVHTPPGHNLYYELWEDRELWCAFQLPSGRCDWTTEAVSPWHAGTTWAGHAWSTMRREHLHTMRRYSPQKNYMSLLADYRRDCCLYAGDAVADAIDLLPWDHYHDRMRETLLDGLKHAGDRLDTHALVFRLRPDLMGPARLALFNQSFPADATTDHLAVEPLDEIEGPHFSEAAYLYAANEPTARIDPSAARHYLYANLLTHFAEVAARLHLTRPLFFSVTHALFRM